MSILTSYNESKPKIFYQEEEIQPLTAQDVHRRQRLFGRNIIDKHTSRSWYYILLSSLFDPFNVLLIGISCLSIFLNDLKTFGIMLVMVGISGGIRFFQEQQSETKLNDLTSMVKKSVTVVRRNLLFEYEEIVDLSELVPGDFVKLSAGDRVPADIQLIKANSLFVDQSILTGEPMPCLKYVLGKSDAAIIIQYNLNDPGFYQLKKLTWQNRLKALCLAGLRNNFGLDFEEEKITFDSSVLVQFDKNDLLFMGTSVISGSGLGIVLATGKRTFFGVMSEHISFHKPITSFNKGIKQISLIFILMMCVITLPIILLKGIDPFNELAQMTRGARWIYAAQFALSVAVGLTPEMLPCILNANLAKGTISLSNNNCLVKRIESITNLGSMSVLCTDKTGTLTENFAQLCSVFDYRKRNCLIGLELAYLNSAHQEAFRNLTDQAIIQAYEDKVPIRAFDPDDFTINKVKEIPFDFCRRKVTVVYDVPEYGLRVLITKGAVNEMLEVCTHCTDQGESLKNSPVPLAKLFALLKQLEKPTETSDQEASPNQNSEPNEDLKNSEPVLKLKKLTPEILAELHHYNDQLNGEGYRVLAVAFQIEHVKLVEKSSDQADDKVVDPPNELPEMHEKDLVFVCYLTFLNPPKTSAAKAINDLIRNNVKVKVLTGDTMEVCKNVCKQIGLSTNSIITSKELNPLSEKELQEAAVKTVIFSQLTPIQKFNIVRVLKKDGHVVGFLGDGINDVLALKAADVGISVDSGTEIAKDAADIILLEKELDVINVGVMCGRRSYVNVVKYISMAISGNFGNVISIFVGCIFIPFLPMAPIHILLQNLLYDISQMTMPWDNVDEETLRKPEVFKMRNMLSFMFFFGPVSSFFDILTFVFLYSHYGIRTDQDDTMLFQTGWFTVGLLTQTLVCHFMRTHLLPVIQSNASCKVYFSTGITLVFGLIVPFLSLGKVFNMKELPASFYYFLALILFAYCLSAELLKKVYIAQFKSWFTELE